MKNLNKELTTLNEPFKAMLFYASNTEDREYYVEAWDVNENGRLVDPHPLSLKESQQLAETLLTTDRLSDHYLVPKGLLPDQVLYTRSGQNGFVIWYTPPQRRRLVFTTSLGLKDGEYALPGLLWKADRGQLQLFALKESSKPTLNTQLFQAPFFNIYEDGRVCMGTVDITIDRYSYLEDFMSEWEHYFFQSKFSHTLGNRAPLKGNIVQRWKSLQDNPKKFPANCLLKQQLTIKNLIA